MRIKISEEKLMNGVIERAAAVGLENVRTKDISVSAGCSVGALFSHYPSKEALLKETYNHIMEKYISFLTQCISDSEAQEEPESAESIWKDLYRYMLQNKDDTLYVIRYRQSLCYCTEMKRNQDSSKESHEKLIELLKSKYKKEGDITEMPFGNILDICLCAAKRVITGEEQDPEMAERITAAAASAVTREFLVPENG